MRACVEDELHILHEPEGEHLVRLVENAEQQARRVENRPLDKVLHAPWCAHHHVDACGETKKFSPTLAGQKEGRPSNEPFFRARAWASNGAPPYTHTHTRDTAAP